MIIGVGIDAVEVARIEAARRRWGGRFLGRVYTPGELSHCLDSANRDQRLAARFAAKEAALKALGTGLTAGARWRDVQVGSAGSEAPRLALSGAALERAQKLQVTGIHLTLSHTAGLAMAVVVLEK